MLFRSAGASSYAVASACHYGDFAREVKKSVDIIHNSLNYILTITMAFGILIMFAVKNNCESVLQTVKMCVYSIETTETGNGAT